MFGKLNHLAITSDHYTLLGMFYRAAFGLKASGDTAREIGAISVGDGYLLRFSEGALEQLVCCAPHEANVVLTEVEKLKPIY